MKRRSSAKTRHAGAIVRKSATIGVSAKMHAVPATTRFSVRRVKCAGLLGQRVTLVAKSSGRAGLHGLCKESVCGMSARTSRCRGFSGETCYLACKVAQD